MDHKTLAQQLPALGMAMMQPSAPYEDFSSGLTIDSQQIQKPQVDYTSNLERGNQANQDCEKDGIIKKLNNTASLNNCDNIEEFKKNVSDNSDSVPQEHSLSKKIKISLVLDPLKINDKQVFEEELHQLPTRKMYIALWFMAPILIFLNIFCDNFEKLISIHNLFIIFFLSAVFFMELGLIIVFIGHKKLINLFRSLFSGATVVFLFIGIAISVNCIVKQIQGHYNYRPMTNYDHYRQQYRSNDVEKVYYSYYSIDMGELPELESWLAIIMKCILVSGGLIFNLMTLMVLSICGWEIQQHTEMEDHQHKIWNFKIYSPWIFRFFLLKMNFCLATIFATVVIKINRTLVPDAIMATENAERFLWINICGIGLVLIGYFMFCYFEKNKDHYVNKRPIIISNFNQV